jgi:voltage-gated potassium channel
MLRSERNLRMEEVRLPEQFVPATIGALDLRDPGYVLLAVRCDDAWVFNPADDYLLAPGNTLIIMTSPTGMQSLESRLSEQVA